jgi:hypothetical protein
MLQAMLVAVFAAPVLEARDRPSTYSSRRPARQVPTSVDQVVSFTIESVNAMLVVEPKLPCRRPGPEAAS